MIFKPKKWAHIVGTYGGGTHLRQFKALQKWIFS